MLAPARRRPVGFLVMVVALLVCLTLPPLFSELSGRGQRAIVVTVIAVVLWTTAALESGATSLLAIVLLALGASGLALAGVALRRGQGPWVDPAPSDTAEITS